MICIDEIIDYQISLINRARKTTNKVLSLLLILAANTTAAIIAVKFG
jgi:hypothetical protein